MPKIRNGLKIGLIYSSIIFAVSCIALAMLMLTADLSADLIGILGYAVIGFICYSSSYISTQTCRYSGLLQGLLCGVLNFSAMSVLSVIFNGLTFSKAFLIKLIICVTFGFLGGIVGINSKMTKL